MKKKIIIIVILIAIALVALLIPKEKYSEWFGKNDKQDPATNYSLLVYVEDSRDRIVGLNVSVEELSDDAIRQKWDLMTKNSSLIPEGYQSLLPVNVELNDYIIENNCLKLNVSEEILNSEGRKTLESLVWTYVDNDIHEIELYVDGNKVSEVGEFSFSKLNKQMGINFTYETYYLYESTATTIIYQEDNYILPVTYFHLEEDICDYIVMKALNTGETPITDKVYNYTFEESILTLDFVDASILSTNQIATISESIALNMDVNSLNINNNENIFYQRVFEEMTDAE